MKYNQRNFLFYATNTLLTGHKQPQTFAQRVKGIVSFLTIFGDMYFLRWAARYAFNKLCCTKNEKLFYS